MVDKALIKDNSLFADFGDAQLAKLAAIFSERSFASGETVIPEHAENKEMMILVSGRVAIEVALSLSASAERTVVTMEDTPGRIIEWSTAIDTTKAGATAGARAAADTRVIVADGAEVLKLLQQDKELGWKFMHRILLVIASRLKDTRLQLVSMAAQCR
ncbi:MAG: cyclic nucleotide-binding domain-containing protein [Candidatus Edwardsbacteria bacterium]|jgi:CRP-like cAMP-binding protein|nr:cyclic nucleotide-binding domain-containing protein [Candidatus Edwardsbacteria bacterium]